jgi:hypothetical protein
METRDFEPVDRTGWPPGPWDDEPDRIEWIDEATGQPCLMRRNGFGAKVYRDVPYVREQVTDLARQLAELS